MVLDYYRYMLSNRFPIRHQTAYLISGENQELATHSHGSVASGSKTLRRTCYSEEEIPNTVQYVEAG